METTLTTYEKVGELTELYHFPSTKTITSLKKVISLTTNEQGVQHAEELFQVVSKIKDGLPKSNAEVNLDLIAQELELTNKNLTVINGLLESIKVLFDKCGNEGVEIEIDDDYMLTFLDFMEKVQKELEYVSHYLKLVSDIHKTKADIKSGIKINYLTADELIEQIKAA